MIKNKSSLPIISITDHLHISSSIPYIISLISRHISRFLSSYTPPPQFYNCFCFLYQSFTAIKEGFFLDCIFSATAAISFSAAVRPIFWWHFHERRICLPVAPVHCVKLFQNTFLVFEKDIC